MVFSSVIFLFYFLPLFFIFYYLADRKYKNGLILLGSIIFYAWGAPRFIFVILGTTVVDFYIVRVMSATNIDYKRKLLLAASLCLNLGLLFYFKYCNFFIENVNHLLLTWKMKPVGWTEIILPIGISFFTFETMTYVVDVYKGLNKPVRHFWDYQLYIILFPKLIAGPIIPYHDFAGQIHTHTEHETSENKLRGLYRFCIGLGKKVLIANVMGKAADHVFGMQADELDTITAWLGAISYTFQIYFDFSGYSDMAIGLGQMMGFRFPENFNNPYTALSITDFWRKWHITLGNWMRTYLYIPLGGNKVNSKLRLLFNLWIVFLASGLWHGAAWGFIIWGAYHGLFLIIERIFLGKYLAKIGKAACIYTFVVVLIGWVFFRAVRLDHSLYFLERMFSWYAGADRWIPDNEYIGILAIAIFFSFFALPKVGARIQQQFFYGDYTMRKHYLVGFSLLLLFIISAGRLTTYNSDIFLYFRF